MRGPPLQPMPDARSRHRDGGVRLQSRGLAHVRLCAAAPAGRAARWSSCCMAAARHAAAFAADAGWLALAQQHRLGAAAARADQRQQSRAMLQLVSPRRYPPQQRRGHVDPADDQAGGQTVSSDPRRIFIAGFSAGGGMAAAMLAAYPAVFAAGGVAAGMPVGTARTQMQAVLRMRRGSPLRSRQYLAASVRAAAPRRATRAWPRLAIWQGALDRTVNPGNAEALAAAVERAARLGLSADDPRMRWRPASAPQPGAGRPGPPSSFGPLTLSGTAFPVDPRTPGGGQVGPWVVDAGLSAAQGMAAFWGIEAARADPVLVPAAPGADPM